MGKYSDYVLISDMDGTLLNSKREVSQENREALRRFALPQAGRRRTPGSFCRGLR